MTPSSPASTLSACHHSKSRSTPYSPTASPSNQTQTPMDPTRYSTAYLQNFSNSELLSQANLSALTTNLPLCAKVIRFISEITMFITLPSILNLFSY